LLAQIFMASTYPLEVVEAARWVKANPNVKDKALEDAMQKQTWDPAVKSLTAVPQVLEQMNDKLDWTQKLGDAFLAQQKDVMDTVQSLRAKAAAAGNLQTTKEQQVIVEGDDHHRIGQPQVIYVPTYNPTVVYGAWPYRLIRLPTTIRRDMWPGPPCSPLAWGWPRIRLGVWVGPLRLARRRCRR
jgi:hypothetical protein